MQRGPHFPPFVPTRWGITNLTNGKSPGLGSDPSWDKWVSLVPNSLQIVLGTNGVSLGPDSLQIVLGTNGFP